jgi:hypothetical protein
VGQAVRHQDRHNLRGNSDGALDEEAVAARLGVKMIVIQTTARELITRPTLIELLNSLETAQQPILIHCLRGIERSGTASAIAAMAIGGADFDKAEDMAFVLPGPWKIKNSFAHISDVLESYEDYCDHEGLDYGGWPEFRHWAVDIYHPSFYDVDITAPSELAAQPGQALDVEVKVTNKSGETIPAGDPKRSFKLIVYTNGPIYHQETSTILEQPAFLPRADVPPNKTFAVKQKLVVPEAPGEYTVYFDLLDDPNTTFGRQGSDPKVCRLHVAAQPSVASPQAAPVGAPAVSAD